MITAYPLSWPQGQPRTPAHRVQKSRFTSAVKTQDYIQKELVNEVRLLGGSGLIISTNIELRNDGLPYANRRPVRDAGVAVYFKRKGKDQCFACDSWATVAENMRAICLTISALRGIDRWGCGDALDRAFVGFAALPAPGGHSKRNWWTVLGVSSDASAIEAEAAYKGLARAHHPDNGGDPAVMSEVNEARAAMRREKADDQ